VKKGADPCPASGTAFENSDMRLARAYSIPELISRELSPIQISGPWLMLTSPKHTSANTTAISR
jgi:hypothetical protein